MPYTSSSSAFVHIAEPVSPGANWAFIDHEQLNNHPEAMIFVTQNWLEDNGEVYNPHSIGVWYNKEAKKWTIFNQDRQPMPKGAAFNVWILPSIASNTSAVSASSGDTNHAAPSHVSTASNAPTISTSRRFFRKVLFCLIFILPVIWLIGDIFFYMQQNMNTTNWENMFMLRDNPLISIVLLLLVIILFWVSIERHWSKLLKWFGQSDPLDYPMQTGFFLFVAYLAILLLMSFLIPHMAGYTFTNDWALLLVATIPLMALIALMLIKKYSSLKVGGGVFSLEFSGVMMTSESDQTQTIMIDMTLEKSKIEYDLMRKEDTMPAGAHILTVKIDDKSPLEISMLKKYVDKVSKMAAISYIVFVNGVMGYIGSITTEKFNANLLSPSFPQSLTVDSLKELGVDTLYLKKPEDQFAILESYRRMVEDNIAGIPVLDERLKFLGVMERSKIEQAVVMQLLEKGSNLSRLKGKTAI